MTDAAECGEAIGWRHRVDPGSLAREMDPSPSSTEEDSQHGPDPV